MKKLTPQLSSRTKSRSRIFSPTGVVMGNLDNYVEVKNPKDVFPYLVPVKTKEK
jgi:hypothetical protein